MIVLRMQHVETLEALFAKTPKEARILFARTINQSAEAVRVQASRDIRAKYWIRAENIKNAIKIDKATVRKLSAHVLTSGPVIPLMKFDVTPTMPDIMPVHARVKKGGSRELIENGFVARVKNRHVNVFTRKEKSRFPIKGRYGPSIAQMMREATVIANMEAHAQETLDKQMEQEINRLLYGG